MDNELEQDIAALWSLLFEIIVEAEKRLEGHLAQHGLTPPQFFVLKTLFEHQGRCPIGQIAREHHLTNATVSGLINRLEAMQPPLVVRERSEADRRSITVIMTPAGEERFFAIQHDILEQAKIILRLLSKEERQDILEKISRYYKIVLELFPIDTTASGKRLG